MTPQELRDGARETLKEALGLPISEDTKLHGLTAGAIITLMARYAKQVLATHRDPKP